MDVKYKFLSECVDKKAIYITYIATADNIADSLTKPLSHTQFGELTKLMDIEC